MRMSREFFADIDGHACKKIEADMGAIQPLYVHFGLNDGVRAELFGFSCKDTHRFVERGLLVTMKGHFAGDCCRNHPEWAGVLNVRQGKAFRRDKKINHWNNL